MQLTLATQEVPRKRGAGRPNIGGRQMTKQLQIRISEDEARSLKAITKELHTDNAKLIRGIIEAVTAKNDPSKEYVTISIEGIPQKIEKQEAKLLLKQLTEKLLN